MRKLTVPFAKARGKSAAPPGRLTGSAPLARKDRPVRHVVFYTKPGCHLCEQAEELLEDLHADYDLRITPVDITSDLAVFARYRYEIPVVVVEEGGTVSGRID